MFSFKKLTERARDAAAAGKAKAPKRRIRFIERAGKMVAQVDELRGLKWIPTEVIEEVDLHQVARCERAAQLVNAGRLSRPMAARMLRAADTGMAPAASPFGHFANVPSGNGDGETAGDFMMLDTGAVDFAILDATDADTAGFWKKVKKAAKKIGKNKVVRVIAKAHTVPLKAAHKITHGKNSPIRKAELAMQRTITKNLPITKPFIAVHNKLASATDKVITGKKTGKKPSIKELKDALPNRADIAKLAETNRVLKANAIASALKKVPKAQQAEAREVLVKKAKSWVVISPATGITHSFQL
jgi:hypothetical protein